MSSVIQYDKDIVRFINILTSNLNNMINDCKEMKTMAEGSSEFWKGQDSSAFTSKLNTKISEIETYKDGLSELVSGIDQTYSEREGYEEDLAGSVPQ